MHLLNLIQVLIHDVVCVGLAHGQEASLQLLRARIVHRAGKRAPVLACALRRRQMLYFALSGLDLGLHGLR